MCAPWAVVLGREEPGGLEGAPLLPEGQCERSRDLSPHTPPSPPPPRGPHTSDGSHQHEQIRLRDLEEYCTSPKATLPRAERRGLGLPGSVSLLGLRAPRLVGSERSLAWSLALGPRAIPVPEDLQLAPAVAIS